MNNCRYTLVNVSVNRVHPRPNNTWDCKNFNSQVQIPSSSSPHTKFPTIKHPPAIPATSRDQQKITNSQVAILLSKTIQYSHRYSRPKSYAPQVTDSLQPVSSFSRWSLRMRSLNKESWTSHLRFLCFYFLLHGYFIAG